MLYALCLEKIGCRRLQAAFPSVTESYMLTKLKTFLKEVLPAPIYNFLRFLRRWRDLFSSISFLQNDSFNLSFKDKFRIVKQLYVISFNVDSPHTQGEILNFIRSILSLPPESNGVLVEAGCFKGSSTSKFSLAADIMGKDLVVFDSFQGIPENDERHSKNIGGKVSFKQGALCGTLDEVKTNVRNFGKIKNCRFVQGWFDDTMPGFKQPISAIYLDVDLASSTRTCLKYLYPLLEAGGVLYSHDGNRSLVVDVFGDDDFWMNEVGCKKPHIFGLGTNKLIKVIKEA
jgi:O-methyltransferase